MSAEYSVEGYQFDLEAFFPLRVFDQITEVRVNDEVLYTAAEYRAGDNRFYFDSTGR